MASQLETRCSDLVERLGLGARADVSSVRALTGGVASDIAAVDVGNRRICTKFALEKLRVAEEWHAPVDRNGAEYAWLAFAGKTVPGSAPMLFGRDAELNGFAMEFLQGDDIYLWKTALLDGQPDRDEAAKVAEALGEIHAASARSGFDAVPFQNRQDFYDLRLEPYLAHAASVHTKLAASMQSLIESLQSNERVLIHGDVSPKNILFRNGEPVFLDAECATMGDPGFDVAFCLNHLLLKSFHMPDRADERLASVHRFWAAYASKVHWENVGELENRVCKLLPALMLARIDGKSPVEYLSGGNHKRIRAFSIPLVGEPPATLEDLTGKVFAELTEHQS